MFGLGKSKEPLADAKNAERWFDSLPASDPLLVHGAVLTELGRLADPTTKRTPSRLAAVFTLDAKADELRKSLTSQYLDHGLRSGRIEGQLWQTLFDLAQGFLVCYDAFRRDVAGAGDRSRWNPQIPYLFARQVVHQGFDAKIRLYRFEHWIPAKWTELHQLFTLASNLKVERTPLPALPGGVVTTVEQEYIRVLVMQVMNSGTLTPRHLEWIVDQLSEWCAPLRFTPDAAAATSFYVDLDSRAGLKRRAGQAPEGHVLFLDTRPLHSILHQNVVVLEQKVRNNPLSERTPRRAEQLNLLCKLAAQVDPEYKPFARRGERTSAAGSVDAIVGFAKISAFLKDQMLEPVADTGVKEGSYDETIELATFGRVRNEPSRAIDVARRRFAAFAAPGGAWEVRDVSQTGYRLVSPMSIANVVTLGMLTAIRPEGQALWLLGVVRRMKRLTSDRAEIGLQVIAHTLVGVELSGARPEEAGPAPDSSETADGGRRFPGLFLSLHKREGQAPVQTLIVPAGEFHVGKRLLMASAATSYAVSFGRLLEQHPDWVWATIESLELSHASRAATS